MSNFISEELLSKEAAKKPAGDVGAASVAETRRAIDAALAGTQYSCKTVSWDDVSRGTVDGSLSCWGSNITDTFLKAKDGRELFTVRSDNWNEKLGAVHAEDIALLLGNCETNGTLRNITLKQFLDDPAGCGAAYAGMEPDVKLSDAGVDKQVSIRFQTVFLPVGEGESGRGTMQFAAEAYNYSTMSDDDPRNLVLLATTQGLSVQADGVGAKRLLLHAGTPGDVSEYWLEAESSKHKVGGEQKETKEEREDALQRGKATSEVIGIKAMGTRFNVLMTIQVPLMQKPVPRRAKYAFVSGGNSTADGMAAFTCMSAPMAGVSIPPPGVVGASMSMAADMRFVEEYEWEEESAESEEFSETDETAAISHAYPMKDTLVLCSLKIPRGSRKGTASAARVSRGDFYAKHKGLSVTAPKRNPKEHVTVTCVLYNMVLGGVPTAADVLAAVEDMEKLFAACTASGRLADAGFDFMKTELTVGDMVKIVDKVTMQKPIAPPPPPRVLSKLSNPKDVVLAKVAEVEGMNAVSAEKVLELRLLTLGAVHDDVVKTLLGRKFDVLKSKVEAGDGDETRAMLLEVKLLVRGALN